MPKNTTRQSLKIGLIARADNGGLGHQTKEFYDHMKPAKTLVVDIDYLTGYKSDFSRYPNTQVARGFEISQEAIDSFLESLDIVFTVECPYNHYLYSKAREMGIKTVCQQNWEFLAHHHEPNLPKPDLWLAPSKWHFQDPFFGMPNKYLHVPINRQKFPFKKRTQAKEFLHIAGHQAAGDRNGTAILLEALPFIHTDIHITIRSQDPLPRPYTDHKVTIELGDVQEPKDLFNGEDVLILPRRYGGLSLQLNEAMSLGMLPIMLNVDPQNQFIDPRLLIEPSSHENLLIKTNVDVWGCTPQELGEKIDEIACLNQEAIEELSEQSNLYARVRDWKIMAPKYMEVFEKLCL